MKLGSVESALLLSNQYDIFYGLSSGDELDNILGPCLYREEESLDNSKRFYGLLDLYSKLSIGKLYNLSLKEFVNLTRAEINMIIRHGKIVLDSRTEDMEDIEETLNNTG